MPKLPTLGLVRGVIALTVALAAGTAFAQVSPAPAAAPRPPAGVKAVDTPNDGGGSVDVRWALSPDDTAGAKSVISYIILKAPSSAGPWSGADTVPAASDSATVPDLKDGSRYYFRVTALGLAGASDAPGIGGPAIPTASWFDSDRVNMFIVLVFYSIAFFVFLEMARKGRNVFVRRIPGLAALEDAIGRATEMGRPVLYVPGIQDMKDIQTICSMVILGDVAKLTARYDIPLIVPTADPVVLSAAEERVKGGHAAAGRPDSYDPNNILYLSNEQFAYVAGITGIMNRQKPATVIYMGSFYAESLMLAETGFATGAVQVAGTANVHQIPFFVVACDYTLIGEELYAASAYLSRDPELLGSLKASDATKIVLIVLILVGLVMLTVANNSAIPNWFIAR